MRVLWAVLKREYLERVRTRWFVIATLFGPLLFGSLMFLPSYLGQRTKAAADAARIRILDATGTNLGQLVAFELGGGITGNPSITQVEQATAATLAEAEARARAAVTAKELRGYLVLPSDILASGNARYVGVNATAIADMDQLRTTVQRQLLTTQMQAAGVSPSTAERISGQRFNLKADRLTASGESGGSGRLSLLFAITVSMLLYFTILLYGQNVLRSVMEEKQTRVAEVIVASVRPSHLLAGKVLGVGAVGLTQMVIWIVAALLMAKYRVKMLALLGVGAMPLVGIPPISVGMVITLVLYFLLGYILYAALFAAVGAMTSTEQEAQQAQLPVVLLLVGGIMFLQPVLSAPEGTLAKVLAWFPFTAPIMMPLRLTAVEVAPWDIALSILALLIFSYLAIAFAARIYRTGILMYGKRATLAEVIRWARQSS
ncbi:MAG: ABC transporter permease [Gemmatimonadaceae bacterium]|nr:ABC transporter permease [Gemmatimonadaceae bacterium]